MHFRSETYPTSLRGTGAGWAAGVGRIASIVAPLSVPPLLAAGGAPLLPRRVESDRLRLVSAKAVGQFARVVYAVTPPSA